MDSESTPTSHETCMFGGAEFQRKNTQLACEYVTKAYGSEGTEIALICCIYSPST